MRVTFFFLGFAAFGLVLFAAFGNIADDESWFRSLGQAAWIVAVLLIVSDIVIPIPTTLVITFMGLMYGPILGGLIGTLGCVLAGLVAYSSTRLMGRRAAEWLLGKELERTERFFSNSGAFAVVCSRWLPILPEAISCLAGLARMPLGRYFLALVCGALPMCFAYAALASVSTNEYIPLLISVVLPVPIWWIAGRLLYRRRAKSAY